jgi:hypothetical protein
VLAVEEPPALEGLLEGEGGAPPALEGADVGWVEVGCEEKQALDLE